MSKEIKLYSWRANDNLGEKAEAIVAGMREPRIDSMDLLAAVWHEAKKQGVKLSLRRLGANWATEAEYTHDEIEVCLEYNISCL
jgi:hypothetical protein